MVCIQVELSRTLMGHTRALSCCAASTDHCATADIGGRIIVWAVADKFAKVIPTVVYCCMVQSATMCTSLI
jgi:hypothetical protein